MSAEKELPQGSTTNLTPIGWVVVLFLIYLVANTGWGKQIIGTTLILILAFLLLVHYQQLNEIMYYEGSFGES